MSSRSHTKVPRDHGRTICYYTPKKAIIVTESIRGSRDPSARSASTPRAPSHHSASSKSGSKTAEALIPRPSSSRPASSRASSRHSSQQLVRVPRQTPPSTAASSREESYYPATYYPGSYCGYPPGYSANGTMQVQQETGVAHGWSAENGYETYVYVPTGVAVAPAAHLGNETHIP